MKLEQLHYLREVCKYGTMSVAAEKNYISQPALSAAISKLEKELGITLLVRQSKGVQPTKEGAMILEKIDIIFDSIDEIEQIAKKKFHSLEITLAATQSICDAFLPYVLHQLNKDNAPFSLSLHVLENHVIYQRVTTGNAHFGIVAHEPNLMNSNLQFHPLFSDEYLLYVGPKSPLWQQDQVKLEELYEQPYIAYGDEFLDVRAEWNEALFSLKRPNISLRINNTNAIRNMILHENYVAFFPKFSALSDYYVTNGYIKALPIENTTLPVHYGCIESTHYKRSNEERAFIEYLERSVQELNFSI